MEIRPALRIDVRGDTVVITGPRDVMKKAIDLSLVRHLECDGLVGVQLYDPPLSHSYGSAKHLSTGKRCGLAGTVGAS